MYDFWYSMDFFSSPRIILRETQHAQYVLMLWLFLSHFCYFDNNNNSSHNAHRLSTANQLAHKTALNLALGCVYDFFFVECVNVSHLPSKMNNKVKAHNSKRFYQEKILRMRSIIVVCICLCVWKESHTVLDISFNPVSAKMCEKLDEEGVRVEINEKRIVGHRKYTHAGVFVFFSSSLFLHFDELRQ